MKKRNFIIILAIVVIAIAIDQINQLHLQKHDKNYMAIKKRNAEMYQGDKPLIDWGYRSRKYKRLYE